MAGDPVTEKAAACVLKRAVELDTAKRFTESLVCYQEGLQLLMEALKANGIFLYFYLLMSGYLSYYFTFIYQDRTRIEEPNSGKGWKAT